VTQNAHDRNDERSRRRRETILDAAFHVFSRVGYRDAAVDEIAERAATSKGGLYFHFPTKQALFVELMRTTADKLVERVEREVAAHSDPVERADAALRTVLATFSGHRTMARLLIVDALGAGRDFRAEIEQLHAGFAGLIEGYLDQAVADGIIPPIDTRVASQAWFGALNEVVTRWLVADKAGPLESAYPALRQILFRGVGISDDQIERLPP
jgi:TetR/AcrR family transcriptional regulator, fatty acid metabolism regulator protein